MIAKISWFIQRGLYSGLSRIWDFVYQVRRHLYESGFFASHTFDIPVVSVGNLSFGGSGKTPIVLWMANYFNEIDQTPVIATRGYKGIAENGHAMIEAKQVFRFNADFLGDEALLLARNLEKGAVVVGKRRFDNLRYYLPRLKSQVILLDDGFQHLKIQRDLDILVFDVTRPLNSLRTAPIGYLREGLSALIGAQVIMLNRVDQVTIRQLTEFKNFLRPYVDSSAMWAECIYRPVTLLDITFNPAEDVTALKGRSVFAIAALANPHAFFQTLEDSGVQIVDKFIFPDHHYFTEEELTPILKRCQEQGVWLLASEKDLVKLRRVVNSPLIRALEISVQFTQGERELKEYLKTLVQWRKT